jgi:pyridoxal phosphate enzyme (YggS family)
VTPDGTEARTAQIEGGLAAVRARIEAARLAAGRADSVELVVVTKTFPAADVDILAALGITEVAENRDQEARAKREECAPAAAGLRWHMIGQLQRNKAASVARWADVVESVDRPEIADALGRAASNAGRVLEVLLQVALDVDPRDGRGGVPPAAAMALAERVAEQPGLVLRGVMGVAPYPGDPQEAFGRLQAVSQELRARWPQADRVSAGMSGDLEQAVANGATQVRIGGAVLGQRSYVQ